MIGITDQKIRALKVEGPVVQFVPIIVHLAICAAFSCLGTRQHILEGIFDTHGPDDVGPEPLVSVERELDAGIQQKGSEDIPLRPKTKVDDRIPDAIPARLPAAEDIGEKVRLGSTRASNPAT